MPLLVALGAITLKAILKNLLVHIFILFISGEEGEEDEEEDDPDYDPSKDKSAKDQQAECKQQ